MKFIGLQDRQQRTNIALIGFMGSGKSTVARELAKQTDMNVIDIDENIEKKAGPIKNIFEEKGEAAFRGMENKAIARLQNIKNAVIACGGGAVLGSVNRRILKENCIVIWLFATPQTILSRLKNDRSRPLLNTKDREETVRKILNDRLRLYGQADLVVNTESKTPEEIAGKILDEINLNCSSSLSFFEVKK